jgi:hypothetical protein
MRNKIKLPTKGFVQSAHDVETIIGCTYPSVGFGRSNVIGLCFEQKKIY